MLLFGTQVHTMRGVWQDHKCHGFGEVLLIVPHLKMMSCFVQCCSSCIPDVFLFIQMFMYCPSILLCYVSMCADVADVFTFKNMCITMCLFDKN